MKRIYTNKSVLLSALMALGIFAAPHMALAGQGIDTASGTTDLPFSISGTKVMDMTTSGLQILSGALTINGASGPFGAAELDTVINLKNLATCPDGSAITKNGSTSFSCTPATSVNAGSTASQHWAAIYGYKTVTTSSTITTEPSFSLASVSPIGYTSSVCGSGSTLLYAIMTPVSIDGGHGTGYRPAVVTTPPATNLQNSTSYSMPTPIGCAVATSGGTALYNYNGDIITSSAYGGTLIGYLLP